MSRETLRSRASYRAWHEIGTRWHDNDVYGHVNNVVYYGWIDTAVNAWLLENDLLDIEQGDPIGLVVETGCRYASPVSFPQDVEVGLSVARIGTSSVTYHLGIFVKGVADASAEGHFTHVYVDRASRRPAPLPSSWRTTLEGLLVSG